MAPSDDRPEIARRQDRRRFIKQAAAGTLVVALGGGIYRIAGDELTRKARAQTRPDGKPRLPPGQKVIEALRPMGGQPGSPRTERFRLRVHGECRNPLTLDWAAVLELPQVEVAADVHCVTGWSVLGHRWTGVKIAHLAELAGATRDARYIIFEAAHGYTANVRFREGTRANCLVTHRMNGKPFGRSHGAPVRSLVPDLYFWKSAKWLTGIRFAKRDEPGYWETRGYHNHADPWREERYG
jgi:DMSO/TMAO reductase YedYZ molybdopterin-dependent catalytic subunit